MKGVAIFKDEQDSGLRGRDRAWLQQNKGLRKMFLSSGKKNEYHGLRTK